MSVAPETGAPRAIGALDGVRAIELAGIGPAPMCGRFLAEMGAEVVRVSRPGQALDVSWPFTMRGRRDVVVDLKTASGVSELLTMADRADVLIDPFRPGVAERLGVGPDVCLGRNPRLVFARMTGWGQDGPWSGMAGHDINYISVTGVLDAIGRRDGPPQVPLNLVGDFGGGTMFLLAGILAALYERGASGRGQVVDAAIVDGVVAMSGYIHGMRAAGTWRDERGTNRLDTGAPYYDVYQTSDGRWMAVGAIEPQFWALLVQKLDLDDPPPQHDEERWPELRALLAARFRQRSQREWTDLFLNSDACVTPVLTWNEALENEQLVHRGTLTHVGGTSQPAPAPRFSRSTSSIPASTADARELPSTVAAEWARQSHAANT